MTVQRVPVQNTHESQICPFISPIKIRLKELLVIFPCVHPVVIGGLSQWLFVGSSCVSDSSPLDEKDV